MFLRYFRPSQPTDRRNTNLSSLPVLRKLGILREGRELFKDEDTLNMIKVWVALEVRQFISASVKDVRILTTSQTTAARVSAQAKKGTELEIKINTGPSQFCCFGQFPIPSLRNTGAMLLPLISKAKMITYL